MLNPPTDPLRRPWTRSMPPSDFCVDAVRGCADGARAATPATPRRLTMRTTASVPVEDVEPTPAAENMGSIVDSASPRGGSACAAAAPPCATAVPPVCA